MRYMRQFAVILGITFVGELLNYFIPLPIPGSIYGLILMLAGLMSGLIKLESVKETGEFLVEAMPVMFIPAGVGLITSWNRLADIWIPVVVMIVVSMYAVMFVTGKVTDALLSGKKGSAENESDHS